jgi:hypothetical protein
VLPIRAKKNKCFFFFLNDPRIHFIQNAII